MKKYLKYIVVLGIIVASNFPPLYRFFHLFGDLTLIEGSLTYTYVTKDKKFSYVGQLKDTLVDPYYKRYRLMYPTTNPILYRRQAMRIWKFWRWRDYLSGEYWKQPYMKTTDEEIHKIYNDFGKIYEPYYGEIPPTNHKDSVLAQHHARIPNWIDSLSINLKQ